MPTQLTRFKIEGLHNLRTVDIPDIKDNRLILVGENGTGKSTVANLICYFLTFQWTRMLETNFRSVSATINNKHYEFSRDRVRSFANRTARISRAAGENRFPDRVGKKLQNIFSSYSIPTIEEKFDVIATESRIPSAFLRDEILRFKELSESFEFDDELESLKNSVTGKTLYLPTYRRIEQDLHKILRGVDRRELQRFKRTEFQFQLRERNRGGKLIELVEFGMDDVDKTIREQLRVLEQKAREDLNKLTGEYLHDVINEAYGNVTPEELHGLHERIDPDTTGIGKVLARIPNDILPEADKQHLEQLVTNINLDKEKVTDTKVQIEVHFLTKLVRLYNNQKVAEQALSNFEDVCKHYLIGKSLKYNSDSFEAAIYEDIHGSKIDLPFLSSGEKQIVSLFSYLYLSGNQNYFVVIDEPELSLSVPWQRRFLPDIVKCCNGLIAVTHSPFVYDNELKPYVHALDEFFVPFEPSPELDEEQDPIDESLIFIGDD